MFKYLIPVLVLLVVPIATLAANLSDIAVNVTGLNSDKGKVRIAIFNTKNTYTEDDGSGDKAFQKVAATISGQRASCTFSAVPYGTYAIKLFHDEENSGKFLKNIFGIPKVQYGFSNNARGRFGPAAFEKAQFQVDKPEVKVEITAK